MPTKKTRSIGVGLATLTSSGYPPENGDDVIASSTILKTQYAFIKPLNMRGTALKSAKNFYLELLRVFTIENTLKMRLMTFYIFSESHGVLNPLKMREMLLSDENLYFSTTFKV
ncbi:hypothetical protein SK128_025788 [Halocaridina rubra]|uniref:Uncharacterized protein n=1 Tax=Halocaridina rubra TaxID=373956 RepID=A0AAN8WNC6_HALRR